MKPLDAVRPAARSIFRTTTSPLRALPDFLIIGAQKGGTTSLYLYLAEHPHIGGARIKELNFFDRNFQQGILWYRAQFPTAFHKRYVESIRKQHYIIGEASPNYFFHPHTPKRVAQILPQVKLIALLRNPVERAYSQYRHNVVRGYEKLSFEDAIAGEEERTREEKAKVMASENYYSLSYMRHSYLARGMYADQLERWFSLFPKDQLLLLRSEDLYTDPISAYKLTLAFLDVSIFIPDGLQREFKRYNKSEGSLTNEIDTPLRKRLISYFEPHNARLYELVGRDFGWH